MIGVGIAGLGFIGRLHCESIARIGDARVVAVADRGPTQGDVPADAAQYDSYEALLADPHVEVVLICLPTDLHAKATTAALAAGKHVFCEKPMARRSKEAHRIVEAAGKCDRFLMIGHCVRFWPQYARIKELLDSGRFGPARSASLRRFSATPDWSDENWLLDHRRSGGALLDLHVHDVDFALHLFGRPQHVYAQGVVGPSGGVDQVVALYDYGPELTVSLEGGWMPPGWPFNMAITVCCERATLHWDMLAEKQARQGPRILIHHADGRREWQPVADSTGWAEELRYFFDCIRADRAPTIVTPAQAAQAIELIELEAQSTTERQPIRVA